MKKAYRTLSLSKIIFGLAVIVGLILLVATVVFSKDEVATYTPEPSKPVTPTNDAQKKHYFTFKQDSKLVAQLKTVIRGDMPEVNIQYYVPDNSTRNGEYAVGERSIKVKAGLDPVTERRTLAHEYIHYLQYTVITGKKLDTLNKLVGELIASDYAMQNNLKNYSKTAWNSEGAAYYCTENSDQYLSKELLTICNKYINRDALVMLR